VYYQAVAQDDDDEAVMRWLDELHLRFPFYGSRRLRDALWDYHHYEANRKRVQRLMRHMGLETLHPKPKPNTSRANVAHRVYPYLLRGLTIDRPNQVWATDITYIPMRKGCLYLIAVMDWYSRKVLSWRLSNTLDTGFCVDALQEAIAQYGKPEIFNTDQGCQFTSEAFTNVLKHHEIKISMDGKGRWMDNVFVERLWRSLKYEEVYLKAYENGYDAQRGIGQWITFYNSERRHTSLDRQTPDQVYYHRPSELPMVA
jgi:putative transposase